ncbi:hypothetical protein D5F53_29130 [Paenibacillus lautus]|uniref:Uncharacterized protein n=1 Tax=Paenibacillus lautus TaxID=1401 RepID=A0A385TX95_PAELA|nr:hypothetical protein D5F53_29130 [Paenibacillus lautus]
MGVDYVNRTSMRINDVCDVFFEHRPQNYNKFLDMLQGLSVNGEVVLELENIFILHTREAIDYAYRAGTCEMINTNLLNQFDHTMTTQAVKMLRISSEK